MSKNKSKYQQGKIILVKEEHRKKYCGDLNNIIYRSSWERDFFKSLITNKYVTKVSSEEIIIPYISPKDGKVHRYFMDFYFESVTTSGKFQKHIIEVKPYIQTQKPIMSKTKTGRTTHRSQL